MERQLFAFFQGLRHEQATLTSTLKFLGPSVGIDPMLQVTFEGENREACTSHVQWQFCLGSARG